MKYLGNKSLSSGLYGFLYVAWYLVLVGAVFALGLLCVAMFADPIDDYKISVIGKIKFEMLKEISKDAEAQEFFGNAPVVFKVMALMMLGAITTLLLVILKKARQIFYNFKSNLVFTKENVLMISRASKLLIVFSVITFNFASLLVSLILLILSDVFKNGAALQEEHDLTV